MGVCASPTVDTIVGAFVGTVVGPTSSKAERKSLSLSLPLFTVVMFVDAASSGAIATAVTFADAASVGKAAIMLPMNESWGATEINQDTIIGSCK